MSTVHAEGPFTRVRSVLLCAALLAAGLALLFAARPARAQDNTYAIFPIPAPDSGNEEFGHAVYTLPNGNFVVIDSLYDSATAVDVGAVYLYNALPARDSNIAPLLISRLTGSTNGDHVGLTGITVLANGNFVVASPRWNNGATQRVGAATWVNAATGLTGTVTLTNSLVGVTEFDEIGSGGITALTYGNYVVASPDWDNGTVEDAGAVTWAKGDGSTVGVVSPANSLVGSSELDSVGRVNALTNGNYVVSSPEWDALTIEDVGAATWGNGASGVTGTISASNSLVGVTPFDRVGYNGAAALTNGNYVVQSPYWNDAAKTNVGAATWGNGATGTVGIVSILNSLIGGQAGDAVGIRAIALTNGNYVVQSISWSSPTNTDVGAVTWGNGATGITGLVSPANSIVGSHDDDVVGSGAIAVLTNGNYVINSSSWDNGAVEDAGAVTWGNGEGGTVGIVSPANSFVGTQEDDRVGGHEAIALTNGNYVISSSLWDRGAIKDAGAATWANGTTGIVGSPDIANSLVGEQAEDGISREGIAALANGNYVICSPDWDNGAMTNVGAVTWGDGKAGITGVVTAANSIIGGTAEDLICNAELTPLTNGNYLFSSPSWDNGATQNVGAVTFLRGDALAAGKVTTSNSVVGASTANPFTARRTPLVNGDWIAQSFLWDDGATADVGLVLWGSGTLGASGVPTALNSIMGESANGGIDITFEFNPLLRYLVVGRPADNAVTVVVWPRRTWIANIDN